MVHPACTALLLSPYLMQQALCLSIWRLLQTGQYRSSPESALPLTASPGLPRPGPGTIAFFLLPSRHSPSPNHRSRFRSPETTIMHILPSSFPVYNRTLHLDLFQVLQLGQGETFGSILPPMSLLCSQAWFLHPQNNSVKIPL